jgi:hypothetical protein
MELFALCAVNAFLAEESAYHLPKDDQPKPIFLVNPRTSAADYLKRLKGVSSKLSSDKLPLTHIVATCPLITGLISQSNLEETATQDTTQESASKPKRPKSGEAWPFKIDSFKPNNFISTDHWKKLSNVSISGKK